ncbi:MAG TPA: ATP-binding cassette domain-containing protein [Candidatus Avipropionibacterium avicola]|uniref:ATP-binding cassette domain-containing protein n=1 Tax=Candidatus Avipropionibacterium avicola TaxID=2840701 RepID=A0A9D1H058_9ACTN|nr:ATP-binding cassette domain-containing protein [Candidatus Avipropionibacterium avicola]
MTDERQDTPEDERTDVRPDDHDDPTETDTSPTDERPDPEDVHGADEPSAADDDVDEDRDTVELTVPARHAAPPQVAEPDPQEHPPLMELTDLALVHRGEPVFGPVTATIPTGVLVVVHGAAGSGRSSLLLALAGRMRGTTGTATLLPPPDTDGRLARWRARRDHRRATSIARIGDLVDLDDQLTVGESLTERCLGDQVATAAGQSRFTELSAAAGISLDPSTRIGSLPALERTVLTVILAMVRPARLVVLDDVDANLDTDAQAELLTIVDRLAVHQTTTVVASTCDLRGVPTDTVTITLDPTSPEES